MGRINLPNSYSLEKIRSTCLIRREKSTFSWMVGLLTFKIIHACKEKVILTLVEIGDIRVVKIVVNLINLPNIRDFG